MEDYTLRYALLKDIAFLVETIIEAEKSGTDTLSYTTIFGLTQRQTVEALTRILEEEIDGCELSLSSFMIAEKDGKIAAAVGAWIEGNEGVSSTAIKGSLLAHVLPLDAVRKSSQIANVISELHMEVEKGVIQIGLVYVDGNHRGKNLTQLLINQHITNSKAKSEALTQVHVQVFGNNIPAIRAYEKFGFKKMKEVRSLSENITDYLPYHTKIAMMLNI